MTRSFLVKETLRKIHLAIAFLFSVAVLTSASLDAPLADAVEQRDRERLVTLLEQGVDVNASQIDGMTALHWAAYHDELEAAKLLIEAGADVNTTNRYGVVPLMMAATNGNGHLVELFLNQGSDPNAVLMGGETVLMTASRTGDLRSVEMLLAHGADVNVQEDRGQTALMWAAAEGHVKIVRALLEADADSTVRLKSGFNALLFAVREACFEVVGLLLESGASPNEMIETILSPVGGRAANGTSALMLAVTNAHYELGALLLDSGADPNADLTGYTALHRIISVRKPGIGDNDPSPDGSGSMSSIKFVRKLAESGANLNVRMTKKINLGNTRLNKLEATPFFLAAHAADAELMRLLVELGADPLLTNSDGTTPLMALTGVGTRSPGEDAGTEDEVLEAVRVALALGADINAVNDQGETAMHGAAYKNLPRVVEFLALNGADIQIWDKKNKWGWTPLDIAEGYRFGNFKPSPPTIEALHRVMIAGGVNPYVGRTQVESQQIY